MRAFTVLVLSSAILATSAFAEATAAESAKQAKLRELHMELTLKRDELETRISQSSRSPTDPARVAASRIVSATDDVLREIGSPGGPLDPPRADRAMKSPARRSDLGAAGIPYVGPIIAADKTIRENGAETVGIPYVGPLIKDIDGLLTAIRGLLAQMAAEDRAGAAAETKR